MAPFNFKDSLHTTSEGLHGPADLRGVHGPGHCTDGAFEGGQFVVMCCTGLPLQLSLQIIITRIKIWGVGGSGL